MTELPLVDADLSAPEAVALSLGSAFVYSRRDRDKDLNEDCVDVIEGPSWCVLVVADGAGAAPRGADASRLAVQEVRASLAGELGDSTERRNRILDGFEGANTAVQALGVGALTTLAIAEIGEGTVRAYHAGDSRVLVTGQRGRIKLSTVHHSPIGYMVEAGVIDEREAIRHDENNIVSNLVGLPDMRVEVGSAVNLAPRDTVLVGSDGVFDNLDTGQIVDIVRAGPLPVCAEALAKRVAARIESTDPRVHGKPDDVSCILYRQTSLAKR